MLERNRLKANGLCNFLRDANVKWERGKKLDTLDKVFIDLSYCTERVIQSLKNFGVKKNETMESLMERWQFAGLLNFVPSLFKESSTGRPILVVGLGRYVSLYNRTKFVLSRDPVGTDIILKGDFDLFDLISLIGHEQFRGCQQAYSILYMAYKNVYETSDDEYIEGLSYEEKINVINIECSFLKAVCEYSTGKELKSEFMIKIEERLYKGSSRNILGNYYTVYDYGDDSCKCEMARFLIKNDSVDVIFRPKDSSKEYTYSLIYLEPEEGTSSISNIFNVIKLRNEFNDVMAASGELICIWFALHRCGIDLSISGFVVDDKLGSVVAASQSDWKYVVTSLSELDKRRHINAISDGEG